MSWSGNHSSSRLYLALATVRSNIISRRVPISDTTYEKDKNEIRSISIIVSLLICRRQNVGLFLLRTGTFLGACPGVHYYSPTERHVYSYFIIPSRRERSLSLTTCWYISYDTRYSINTIRSILSLVPGTFYTWYPDTGTCFSALSRYRQF